MKRQIISDAVTPLGWRYVLGVAAAHVNVDSLASAVRAAAVVAAVPGTGERVRLDLRADRAILHAEPAGPEDLEMIARVTAALAAAGFTVVADGTAQQLELAIDAMDIPAVRPFWKAVLGYTDAPGESPFTGAVVDPCRRGPAVWFQQMDAPRPQRNRIHFDVSVPHDEAATRIEAAIAAGGRLLSDAEAPAFWVLADAEGNEACVTTWQGRD